jgi:hypothetical protein
MGSEEMIFNRVLTVLALEETPDDGQLAPKHVVRKESVRISFSRLHRDGNNIIVCKV